jgi:hypothetical protein
VTAWIHYKRDLVKKRNRFSTLKEGFATYHDTEREHIRGLAKASFGMGFRATPHAVTNLRTDNVGSRGNIGRVFLSEI